MENTRLERGNVAGVRQELSKISYVSRTWLEWTLEETNWLKTLVIEVNFDTDPNSSKFLGMEEIERVVRDTLENKTTMTVHYIRVVPRQ